MIFKKINLKNIRSYKEEEIYFPEGAVLLAGDIGSGKTTILLAIEYALFGLQPGQRGSALLSKGEDSGEVTLELEANNNHLIIERGLKRNNKSINQDFAVVTINGARFESSITEVKTKILEVLNYPQDFIRKNNLLYRYTIYTPQEEMKQIILEDAESRLDVLRHVFGMDKYKRIKENIQRVTIQLREEARGLQFEVAQIDSKKSDLDSNEKFISILNKKLSDKEVFIKEQIKISKEKEIEIGLLMEKTSEREGFKKEIEKSGIVISNKQEQLASINKELISIELILSKNKSDFDENNILEIIKKINSKTKTIEILNKTYIELFSKNNSLDIMIAQELSKKERVAKLSFCLTCLQDVPDSHKHNILLSSESNIIQIKKDKLKLDSEIQRVSSEISKEKENLKSLETEKSLLVIQKIKLEESKRYEIKKEELMKTKNSIEKDIKLMEEHVYSLKESSFEYLKFEQSLKSKKDEFNLSLKIEKNVEIEQAEIKKELELTVKEANSLKSEIAKSEVTKKKLIDLLDKEIWLSNNFTELVSFTEKMILTTLRKEFTKLFNKWFSMLTTDSFGVYLDETFSPIIVHSDFELDYEFLSGGERTAVALAYRLALNQMINSVLSKIKTQEVIILDEPTDGFSEQQLDKVRDILQELHVKQLIIVSHEPKIESFVDHVIRFRKVNGISSVQQNSNDKIQTF
ncbi:hypothetical protein EXS72_01615 [Candidatus Pacearchaeota archaeon]|nr:hypothetical protein [Candidatus Pacearchaeota archaeon]